MGSSRAHSSDSGCLPCTGLWITGEAAAAPSANQRAADVWSLPVNLYLAFGISERRVFDHKSGLNKVLRVIIYKPLAVKAEDVQIYLRWWELNLLKHLL